jgi:tetratricopeptide (TPR) repeat protein
VQERGPEVPASITADQLDPEARAELRTLPGDLADAVARRLVAASLEEDPARAYAYAQAARSLAARVGIVRETSGIAAYRAGEWADALTELRAARRLTGRESYLPLMADSERALGRLDRALDLVTGPQARGLDRATTIELRIVESGIRRDQGLPDAAVVVLQVPELNDGRIRPGSARLFYAYADALLDAGREDEARDWFARAAAADPEGVTDAADRVEELDPVFFEDFDGSDEADDGADGADDADDDLDDTDPDDVDDLYDADYEDEGDPVAEYPAADDPATDEPAAGDPPHAL